MSAQPNSLRIEAGYTPIPDPSPIEGEGSRTVEPSPSMGEGLGGGARTVATKKTHKAKVVGTAPFEHPAHASGAIKRARRLRQAMTYSEARLWKGLRKLGLNIRRQAPIGPFTVDFACHAANLVIEVDGGVHELPEVQLRDLDRTAWLQSQGYRVLRFTDNQVLSDFEGTIELIASAARGKA